jgi:hypothetical protein
MLSMGTIVFLIFLIYGCLNLKMWNLWICRVAYIEILHNLKTQGSQEKQNIKYNKKYF